MNCLVTGVSGFLGRIIIKELKTTYDTFGLSRSGGDYLVSLENEIPIFAQKYELVIHAAGKAHTIPTILDEKKQFYNVNVIGTLNLLKGLEKSGIPEHFVFISSVSVYGQHIGDNIDEEYALSAIDDYGRSKIEAENIVNNWCISKNVICTILRLPLLVGKNPPGNLGAMLRAIDKGYYFNIGGGNARKSMVLAKDVANLILDMPPVGGIFNLTDGMHPSFKELSDVLSKKRPPINLPLKLTKLLGFFGDIIGSKAPLNSSKIKKITSELTFDDTRARKMLNWSPGLVLDYLKKNYI
jgi:nucleoside-diphosphate-sugar epimerase